MEDGKEGPEKREHHPTCSSPQEVVAKFLD